MNDIERKIKEVDATMAMEGMPLSEEAKKRIEDYLIDPSQFKEILKKLIQEYTVKENE